MRALISVGRRNPSVMLDRNLGSGAVGSLRIGAGFEGVHAPGTGGTAHTTLYFDVPLGRCGICGPLMSKRRCLSNISGKDRSDGSNNLAKKKKRKNIKRTKAQTKKEIIVSPARTVEEADGFSLAIKRSSNIIESNVKSIRDYAQSLVKSDHPRAKRVGPKMDGKWWSVNVAFALSPAVLLALYCESQREGMEEYFHRVKKRERRRIMGDLGGNEDGDQLNEVVIREEKDLKFGAENVTGAQSMTERVIDAVTVLFGFGTNDGDRNVENDNSSSDEERPGEAKLSEEPNHSGGTSGKLDVSKNAMAKKSESLSSSTLSVASSTSDSSTSSSTSEVDLAAIASLQRRIEALEHDKHAAEEDQRQRILQRRRYRLERTNQSGTRNRIEDRWIDEWTEEDRKARVEERKPVDGAVDESVGGVKIKDASKSLSVLGYMKENSQKKGEMLMDYGSAALDYLKGAAIKRHATDEENGSQKQNQATDKSNLGPLKGEQGGAQTSSAVHKSAAAAVTSANAAGAAAEALKHNDGGLAAKRAVDAASSASLAAGASDAAAAAASAALSTGETASPPLSTPAVTSAKKGFVGRMKSWVGKHIHGEP